MRSHREAVRQLSLADSLESGNMRIWKSMNLEIWEIQQSGNLESNNIPEMTILGMQIRSAQNVHRVLICRQTNSLPFRHHFKSLLSWTGRGTRNIMFCLCSLVVQKLVLAAIHLGGAIVCRALKLPLLLPTLMGLFLLIARSFHELLCKDQLPKIELDQQ